MNHALYEEVKAYMTDVPPPELLLSARSESGYKGVHRVTGAANGFWQANCTTSKAAHVISASLLMWGARLLTLSQYERSEMRTHAASAHLHAAKAANQVPAKSANLADDRRSSDGLRGADRR